MSCEPVVFQNVDGNAWACLKAKATDYAHAHNFPLPPLDDKGSVSHSGFSATWDYDPNTSTLTIVCTKHPFFVTCALINGHVRSGIAGTRCIPGL